MRVKNLFFSALFMSGLIATALLNMSSSSGQMGAFSSGCNSGTGCHGTANTTTSISLTGIPTAGYVAGTNYPLTLTITNADSLLISGGFDLNFGGGTLSNNPTGTMLMGSELHHTTPKNKSGNSVSWTFNWTAPSAASTIVNIAGNMVNGNGSENGDKWNITTLSLTQSTTAVNEVEEVKPELFPNPCTMQLTIHNQTLIEDIQVYSLLGQPQTVSGTLKGNQYQLNTQALSPGMYFLYVKGQHAQSKSTFMKL